jgi:glycosyltransferase involved in cell wall biosynthesis
MTKDILYLIGVFPRRSETFIFREVEVMRRMTPIRVVTFSKNTLEAFDDPAHILDSVESPNNNLFNQVLKYFLKKPVRSIRCIALWFFLPHRNAGKRWKAIKKMRYALWFLDHIEKKPPHHIHVHFLGWVSEVALVVSRITGIPWSASAHANDIYVYRNALKNKLYEASFVSTCTSYNRQTLLTHANLVHKIHLDYHGIPIGIFNNFARPSLTPTVTHKIITVGRLVEKKGFNYLIQACAILKKRGFSFNLILIGDGPLYESLTSAIQHEDVGNCVTMIGELNNMQVLKEIASASLFVMPSIITPHGDRDGIPNVIIEAMFLQTPVVATNISGIPEVVKHRETGLLCEPGNAKALAESMIESFTQPEQTRGYTTSAYHFVKKYFDMEKNVQRLYEHIVAPGHDV